MDYLIGFISSVIEDPNAVKWTVYFVAGVSGLTFAVAISLMFSGVYSPIKMKLQKLQHKGATSEQIKNSLNETLEHTLDKVPFIQRTFSGDIKTKRLLIHSGFHSEHALKVFNSIKLLLLLFGGFLSLVTLNLLPDLSTIKTFYVVAIILGGCYLTPGFLLVYLAKKRMVGLRKYFPDALDLLVVCCESGLGLLESLQRVGKELEFAHPALSHELILVCSKVRVGFSMQEALHEFSERTGLEDIRGLNSVIVQSLRLGTGIAETLRIYSEEYRDKRLQEAEENAAKVPVKMLFPMLLFIWPSFFIVAIGPAIIKVLAVWETSF